jgi:hypothetical protein
MSSESYVSHYPNIPFEEDTIVPMSKPSEGEEKTRTPKSS